MSEAIEQLRRLAEVLYIKAKTRQAGDQEMAPIGSDFDMYLSQLGFMPPTAEQMAFDSALSAGATRGVQLGDWFSGNRNIIGLLEEDLSWLHAPAWSTQMGF